MGQKRDFLMRDLRKDPDKALLYDACVSAVLEGRAQARLSMHPAFTSKEILYVEDIDEEVFIDYVLTYYLWKLDTTEFDYEKARTFTEKMRVLFGFGSKGWGHPLLNALEGWVEDNLQSPSKPISEDYFKFACYVAVAHLKYGPDFFSIRANKIFGYVTALGSDLPAKMKKHGSGEMPKDLLEYKDAALSCKANDAFATIRIVMKEESQANYEKVLDFLCALLSADFPRSYSIDFRSPEKNYLPIRKIPKKGVNQLFANAVKYPELHDKIEKYARLAMRKFEWYTNIEGEHNAMPGTFAVFALGLLDKAHTPLVFDYINICDDEHQSIHGEFVLAYIEKYGFTEKGLELYELCEEKIQELPSKLVALRKKLKT